MSESAKKPASAQMDDKTTIMTDPSGGIPTTLNLDDDVIDENFSFDQKTVVNSTPKAATPPPLPPPLQAQTPKVPDVPVATGSFKITNPKINASAPTSAAAQAMDEKTAVTSSSQSSIRVGKGAVKIESTPPIAPMPDIAPGDELEFEKKRMKKAAQKGAPELPPFVQNLLQNKRALAGIGGFLVLALVFGVWKSHQPHKLDLQLDQSSDKPAAVHDGAPASTGPEMPTAEQAASRFETVFQKVQIEGGDVSR